MKTIITNFFYRFKNLICHYSKLLYNNFTFLNVSSASFIIIIIYLFFANLNLESFFSKTNLLGCLISFSVSGLITSFIINKFKYSKYLFIRILQKIIIYSILFTAIGFIFGTQVYCDPGDDATESSETKSDNNNSDSDIASVKTSNDGNKDQYVVIVDKNIADKVMETSVVIAKAITKEVAPNIGAATAAGTAASAAIKATAGMPMLQRAGVVAGSSFVTAASTTIGIAVGSNIAKNSVIIPSANNSTSSDDNIPSPDDSFINSVLETGDYPDISPLENLLGYQLTLNILIFIILILILFIIFNRYILKYNVNFLSYLVQKFDKFLPNRATDWIQNRLNQGIDYNNKFMFIMFIINSVVLIYVLILNLYISVELSGNIDDYVTVYNIIHGKKSILLLSICKNFNNIPSAYSVSSVKSCYNDSFKTPFRSFSLAFLIIIYLLEKSLLVDLLHSTKVINICCLLILITLLITFLQFLVVSKTLNLDFIYKLYYLKGLRGPLKRIIFKWQTFS